MSNSRWRCSTSVACLRDSDPTHAVGGAQLGDRLLGDHPAIADQFTHAGEHAAIQRAALELGEPPFDGIEPRRTGGREVKVHPRMLCKPFVELARLVRAQVVQNDMKVLVLGDLFFHRLHEAQELVGLARLLHLPDHPAAEHVEGREQTGRAIALVVVRGTGYPPGTQRQARLRAIECLDLASLVHAKHQRVARRVYVQPHDIDDLVGEVQIVADLERLDAVGLQIGRFQSSGANVTLACTSSHGALSLRPSRTSNPIDSSTATS